MWLAWAALALATLSKGLIGIVLPGGVLVLYSLIERDWALWRRLHLVSGMLVFLAIAAPWFVVVSLRNPEFFNFFFIHEHFTRFLTTEHRREGPWWYFIPIFMVGILPWLTVLAWTARRSWTEARATERGFSWQRFAIIWSVFIFLFFSASGSKLPSYILPIFPAMALVIGWQLTRIQAATLLRLIVPLVVAMGLLALVALAGFGALAERIADEKQPLAPLLAYGTWIRIAVVVALAGGILAWWWLARGERTRPVLTLALASLAWTQLMVTGFDALAESRSTEPILLRATTRGALATGVPFYSVRMYDQTLPYYLGRTVIPVAHADELAMGIALEPDKAIATVGEWKNRWEGADQAYAIMQPRHRRSALTLDDLDRICISPERRPAQCGGAALPQGGNQCAGGYHPHARELDRSIRPLGAGASPRRRHPLLRRERGRVDHRPLARAGVDRLPDALARLHHQRDRRALPAR